MSDADAAGPEVGVPLLADIKVVEFAQNIAIPQCGRILAGMGANVVKVEPPTGDAMRRANHFGPGEARAYACINPDKRSIVVDLQSEASRPVIEALIGWADVVLVAFKQRDLARYGIDWDTAKALNPGLIHMTHTPFGPEGEYADEGGYDVLAQAMSGMGFTMNRARSPQVPMATRPAVNDCGTGIAAALGIVAALRHRDRTGEGQRVDASLLATAMNLSLPTTSHFPQDRPHGTLTDDEQELLAKWESGAGFEDLRTEIERDPQRGQKPFHVYFRYYRTADGIIAVAGLSPGLMAKFHEATGLERPPRGTELGSPEFDALVEAAEALFLTRSTTEWIDRLRSVGYPCGRFNLPFQGLADPQVRANWFVADFEHPVIGNYTTAGMPFQLSATPVGFRNASPLFGEHTVEVLTEIGFDQPTIDAFAAASAVVVGP